MATLYTTPTGPNSSSLYARISGVTSTSSVGSTYAPGPSIFFPPARSVAPLATASSICSISESAALCEDSGPRTVFASSGSPVGVALKDAASFETNSS